MKATAKAASPRAVRGLGAALVLAAILTFAVCGAGASAAAPEFLWRAPDSGVAGAGAGQLNGPGGVAANPSSGHVYVASFGNARIDEFDAWGRFVKAWGWGVEDGSNELQTCGPAEPESSPPSALCREGLRGVGAGQFDTPFGGIAVGLEGNIFVAEMGLRRTIQKFDANGNFLLAFGSPGEGDGQIESGSSGNRIAVGPAGTIFVSDIKGRIQEFEPDGSFKSKVILEGELGGRDISSLAVDSNGNFYVVAAPETFRTKNLYKFNSAGVLLSTIDIDLQLGSPIAVDGDDNVYVLYEKPYVFTEEQALRPREIIAFDSSGEPFIPIGSGVAVQKLTTGPGNLYDGLATNTVTASGGTGIYVSQVPIGGSNDPNAHFISAYGPPPDKWPAPAKPPEIASQYAVSIGSGEALLRGQISPRFWADTSYYVEYGTGKCSEGGCTAQVPASPRLLGAGVVGNAVTTKGVALLGLSADTTYHYRFVAQSSGGGPVRGVGGKVGLDGSEGTFSTPSLPSPPNTDCANQSFRFGASAFLPDCRAYEMVSPFDKNGADIVGHCDIQCFRSEINQASIDGGKFTYSSYKAFGDAQSGPYANQYLATRGPDGWSTHGISPPFVSGLFEEGGGSYYNLQPEFKAFSADLSRAWLADISKQRLTPDAMSGFSNAYRMETASGSLSALTTGQPIAAPKPNLLMEIEGVTPDGEHALINARAALTPDAPAPELFSKYLYLSSGGEMHFVAILPNGTPLSARSVAGTLYTGDGPAHGYSSLSNAISDDGTRIFWSPIDGSALYLRINPTKEQSALNAGGKCTQPAKACTYALSSDAGKFWTADPSGSKVLFTEGDSEGGKADLYEFDTTTKTSTLIAHSSFGVVGTSEDLSSIYFASADALTAGVTAGQPHLYLEKEGTVTHIATLSAADMAWDASPEPIKHAAKATPDGLHLTFVSNRSLTGYDNTDADNGKADSEVYLYDAAAQRISCVSCNPTGARPDGDELKTPYMVKGGGGFETGQWGAAWLNTSETSLYTVRNFSEDGQRLFFNSFDALVPRDTNGVQDVYQWSAPGSGDCTTESPSFYDPNDGCLSLISSGESPQSSEFVDATPGGSDVFIRTEASLVPGDLALIDIYDARVGGGYPPPPVPPPPCVGDACQSVPAPPDDPTPASAGFRGAGDPSPRKPRRSCRVRKGRAGKAKSQARQKQIKRCKRANRGAGR